MEKTRLHRRIEQTLKRRSEADVEGKILKWIRKQLRAKGWEIKKHSFQKGQGVATTVGKKKVDGGDAWLYCRVSAKGPLDSIKVVSVKISKNAARPSDKAMRAGQTLSPAKSVGTTIPTPQQAERHAK